GIRGHHLPRTIDAREMILIGRAWHGARDRLQHVDCGISAAFGDRALHDDVSVENAPYGVGNRLVMIITVDQDREDSRDRPLLRRAWTGPFQQTRQLGEDGRRVALRRWRLASR